MSLLGSLWNAIRRFLDDRPAGGPDLRGAAERMLELLDQRADAASLAMALADEAYERLQAEMENHEALGRQAEEFLRESDEEAAARCVALQLQSAKQIARLKDRYQTIQREAESNVAAFRRHQGEVDRRLTEMPELEQDERLVRAQERIRDLTRLSLESPQTAFDHAARELRIRQRQLQGKSVLTADPHAELDRRIEAATDRRELEGAMRALRRRVGLPDADGAEIVVEVRLDPVTEARRLLAAPRFQSLALPAADAAARPR
jgi:hypothetical protein